MGGETISRAHDVLAVAVLLGLGCNEPRATAVQTETGGVLERERVLGPFLAEHWVLPIPAQGPSPEGFTAAETSLDPEVCGACHPVQYAQWRTSLHAAAFSPGFAGQLIEGQLSSPASIRHCQTCHAPLSEQQPVSSLGSKQPGYDPLLRGQGIVCAACHVRGHRRYGPPRRAALPPLVQPVPHGGFEEKDEYRESRFCSPCHQFFDDPGVEGKPVENTLAEWRDSPQAKRGIGCQDCHMPDRAHLWRGIHDPEMVRGGVEVYLEIEEAEGGRLRGALRLVNTGVGHAFPTYVTPRVFLHLFQLDAVGVEVEGTRVEGTIGRELDYTTDPFGEIFDTRVLPGEAARIVYDLPRAPQADAIVGRVVVDPDYHYRGVFASLLETLHHPEARRLILEASRRVSDSYVLSETRLDLSTLKADGLGP